MEITFNNMLEIVAMINVGLDAWKKANYHSGKSRAKDFSTFTC